MLQEKAILSRFEEQVAGHKDSIMTLGKDKRHVLKPMTERELNFYLNVFETGMSISSISFILFENHHCEK